MNYKKGIAYVFFATGLGFLINLVTSFILPKILSVEAYADIKLYQLYINYIGILHLGFSDGMYLRIGGKNVSELDKNQLVTEFKTFKIFQLITDVIAVIVSIILKNDILLIVSISILPVNIINYLRNLYQATGLFDLYSKFTTLNNVMLFLLDLFLLFIVKTNNAMYYIFGQLIVYVLNWILIESIIKLKIFKGSKGKLFDIKYLFNDIKDGFLLMLGNFCTILFTSIDRMFVKNILGIAKFAYYSFAVSVEGLLNVFITPISVTMYNYLCKNNSVGKVKHVKSLLLICTAILLASAFPVKFVINGYITKYSEASNIIFILFAAQFISILIRCINNNLYKAEKKQNRYFFIIIIVTILSIVTDVISYKVYNTNEGYAIATLITCIIWFIIVERDFKSCRYNSKEYIFILTIVVSFLITGLYINNAIIGFVVYEAILMLMILLLLKKDFIYLVKEVHKTINKFKNKLIKNEIVR